MIALLKRKKLIESLFLATLFLFSYVFLGRFSHKNQWFNQDLKLIIGPSSDLPASWHGTQDVKKNIPILILAGHADSQGLSGSGTSGEAVGKFGQDPMDPKISDELFWNLKLQASIVQLGKKQGLNMMSYDPGIRHIDDPNDPRTNWSVGKEFAKNGGYVLEIHFDAYGKYGIGAGLIPPVFEFPNKIDESIAQEFGRFPIFFRGGLGAPRRQIRILEIGKLEGSLEKNLRNIKTRQRTIDFISNEIVHAVSRGINGDLLSNPMLGEDDTFLPVIYLETNPEAW